MAQPAPTNPAPITIDFDKKETASFEPIAALFDPAPSISVKNIAETTVDIYPLTAGVDARAIQACRIAVVSNAIKLDPRAPGCKPLLGPLLAGDPTKLAVSPTGSLRYVVIESKKVAFQGADPTIEVTIEKGRAANIAVPEHVQLVSPNCWLWLDGWIQRTCDVSAQQLTFKVDPATVDIHLPWALAAALARGDHPWLFVDTIDADAVNGDWRRLPITSKPSSHDAHDAPATDLQKRCINKIVAPSENTYYVCVDAFRKKQGLVTLTCKPGAKAENGTVGTADCESVGDVIDANRDFIVRASTDDDLQVKVTLGGTAGTTKPIYNPNDKAAGAAQTDTTWNFGPRKAGVPAPLVVAALKPKDDGPGTEVVRIDYAFNPQPVYRLAVRFGLGLSWQPWARDVGIRATPTGQQYTTILDGANHDLVRLELVTGVTYFMLHPAHDDSMDVNIGLGARIGALSLGGDVKALSSAMVGAELTVGTDLAIGLYAGVARTDAPDSGFESGRLVPPGVTTVPTHLAFTPAFAVVLNFVPSVLKAVGVQK